MKRRAIVLRANLSVCESIRGIINSSGYWAAVCLFIYLLDAWVRSFLFCGHTHVIWSRVLFRTEKGIETLYEEQSLTFVAVRVNTKTALWHGTFIFRSPVWMKPAHSFFPNEFFSFMHVHSPQLQMRYAFFLVGIFINCCARGFILSASRAFDRAHKLRAR